MKKKFLLIVVLLLTITMTFFPIVAYANMAAPKDPGVASNITFEKNDSVAVKSEILNIVVKGSFTEITAEYHMKNTTDKDIAITSMFLSPNIENQKKVSVSANGVSLDYKKETYNVNYNTEIKEENGKYIVVESDTMGALVDKVDTIEFVIPFKANEEVVVSVNYVSSLGGYPDNDFDAKRGEIEYYLPIASYWKDFSDLTINLTLDEGLPVLQSSNLEFKKLEKNIYQYKSNELPKENLKIMIDQSIWQKFVSSFNSPYQKMVFTVLTIFACGLAIVIITPIVIVKAVKRAKKRREQGTIDKKNL
ncbi:MAG: hypothetical protein RR107_05425 [Clostridia bacterium]